MRSVRILSLLVAVAGNLAPIYAGSFDVSLDGRGGELGAPPLSITLSSVHSVKAGETDLSLPKIQDGECVFPNGVPLDKSEGGELLFKGLCGSSFEIRYTIANFRDVDTTIRIRQALGLRVRAKDRDFYAVAYYGGRENPNKEEPEAVYRDQKSFACRPDLTHPDPKADPVAIAPTPTPRWATVRLVVDANADTATAYVAWGADTTKWQVIGKTPAPPSAWNTPDATIALHNQTWSGPRIVNLTVISDKLPDHAGTKIAFPKEPAPVAPTKATHGVTVCNGAPAFSLNGTPEYPLYLFEQEVLDKDAAEFRAAGFRYYSSIEWTRHLDLEWVGDYKFEYTKIDRVLKGFAERLPDRYWLPRVHLYAPKWWLDKHPSEALGYCLQPPADEMEHAFPPFAGLHKQSYASELWRKEAGEGLRKLVRHLLDSPYADRVMGIHVAEGVAGEWHPWGQKYLPDTSEPMRQAFIRFVKNKYKTEDALRKAWGDPAVTFDTVKIPGADARRHADVGLFRDPAKGCAVPDYYEAYNATTVEAIDYFCRIVKDESKGKLLTCVLYAYEPDMPYVPMEQDHRAAALAHRLKSVDVFATPHAYWRRDIGEDAAFRTFPESLALHGKVFIDECDEITHLGHQTWFRYADTPDKSLQVLWRGFGNTVTHATGMWYMDQSSGSWYDSPPIREAFKKIQRAADHSMKLPRERIHDVAVIANTHSEFYIGSETELDAQFWVSQDEQLAKAGAPFCRYLIEDLEEGLVPNHKVYIFINCFYLTDGQRAAIEKLKGDGHTLVWFYAPGFVTPTGLSREAMEKLTGLSFKQSDAPFQDIRVDTKLIPNAPESYRARIARVRDEFDEFGKIRDLSPRFSPTALGQEVWGTYAAGGEPGLVTKNMGTWRSVYTPTAHVPWAVLNRIYHEAGVHLYATQGDNLSVNHAWLMLHTLKDKAGVRHVILPKPAPVYDIINDRLLSEKTAQFDVDLPGGTTALFMLAKPEDLGNSK